MPGEKVEDALRRELYEELHLVVEGAHPLLIIDHDYPEQTVTLDVWTVNEWNGQVHGKEGQEIEWVSMQELPNRSFPDADKGIVSAARLPPIYLITPNLTSYDSVFMDTLANLLQAGTRLIQFRCKQLKVDSIRYSLYEMLELCEKYSACLMLNGTAQDASRLGFHGVHLNSQELLKLNKRPLVDQFRVAASCHNEVELKHAEKIGVDFVVLSPVHKTSSHPGSGTLGWDSFEKLTRRVNIPVYALGGMLASDLDSARLSGGQGIAMISGVWDSVDPTASIRSCLY